MIKHLESKNIFEIDYTAPGESEAIRSGYIVADGIVHAIDELRSLASINHLVSIKESDVCLWIPSDNTEAIVSFTAWTSAGNSIIIPIYDRENIEGELAKDLRELETKFQYNMTSVEKSEYPILIIR